MTCRRYHGLTTGCTSYVRAGLTSIYIDTCTRHQRGALGSEKCHHGRNFLRAAKAAQGHVGFDKIGDKSRVVLLPTLPRSAGKENGARGDDIDENVVFGQLFR